MQGISYCFILLLIFFQRGFTEDGARQESSKSCPFGSCLVEEDEGPCEDDGEAKLYRWDPVKVC